MKVEDDLKDQITKLIFDGDTMLPVSSDIGVFGMAMSYLTQYEKVVCIAVVICFVRYLGPPGFYLSVQLFLPHRKA